jgi:hypothetical protein
VPAEPPTATLPAVATEPATATLPAVATDPATATLPAVATDPATATLSMLAIEPTTGPASTATAESHGTAMGSSSQPALKAEECVRRCYLTVLGISAYTDTGVIGQPSQQQ